MIETTNVYNTTPAGFPKTNQSYTADATSDTPMEITHSFVVPAGTGELIITTSGGTHGSNASSWNNNSGNGADLYVDSGTTVATNDYECRSLGSGNDESCTISNPATGDWRVGLNVASRFVGVTINVTFRTTVITSNRCPDQTGTGNKWIDCTSGTATTDTPTGRSFANEKINYATWFSYHRTRIKAAKAGASEAFSLLGTNLRVGYDSIWNRDPPTDTNSTVGTLPTYQIPVGTDGGLFRGSNRSTWYTKLFAAYASNGTPLRSALKRSGDYYSGTADTGPWGPATQTSCRQSFAILTTDGYWNGDSGFSAVGDADSDTSTSEAINPTITGGSNTFKYAPVNPHKDNPSPAGTRADTLADVAMYYWKRDLRPTLTNDVPASSADTAFWQHMVTFGISLGALGTLNPATDLSGITNGSTRWPNPLDDGSGGPDNIDDLWHASINGHGSFVAATNPIEFAQALSDALALIAARRGSASNVATNSTSFQSDTRVFQARYWSGRWTGELAAFPATSAGVSTEPSWQASQGIPAPGSRIIRTWNGLTGAAFPTAGQQTLLDQSSRPLTPVSAADNVAYIKGTTTLELRNDGTLRNREIAIRQGGADVVKPTPLGDIVNSTPIFVQEIQTVFVGSNDGMLHAFNAVTGAERFAYVPSAINISALGGLSDPNYVHSYFVDGPIAVSTTKQTPGHNYLVGSLGRGGKGVFGLEVKTPDTFANTDVLWERSTGANMGNVLGEPVVVKLNNGVNGVIVSNGINSTNGKAVLFVLNIATGAIIAEIDTLVGGDNGLSAPRAWDNDGNGTVDYVYAGDLKGNLWKFDLRGALPADWVVALSGSPLFVAKDALDNPQPITTGLALAKEPSIGRRWIFIGTGKFLETTDVPTVTTQSMYGIIDDDTAAVTGRTSGGDGDLQARSILAAGTFTDTQDTVPTADDVTYDVRGFQAPAALPSGRKGWYLDLVKPPSATQEGERIVSAPRIFGKVLVTSSMIPPTANTCDAGGGGYINALNGFTGTSLDDGFFNVNGNSTGGVQNFDDDTITSGSTTVFVGSLDLRLGIPTLPTLIDKLLVAGGSTGTIGSVSVNPQGAGSRRTSWREIRKD